MILTDKTTECTIGLPDYNGKRVVKESYIRLDGESTEGFQHRMNQAFEGFEARHKCLYEYSAKKGQEKEEEARENKDWS